MRNKILVVESDKEAHEQLLQILQEVVDEGGELFLTSQREEGLAILKRESPQVVLLDTALIGVRGQWEQEGVHVILILHRHDISYKDEECVMKPFRPYQVLEKCREYLNQEAVPPTRPM